MDAGSHNSISALPYSSTNFIILQHRLFRPMRHCSLIDIVRSIRVKNLIRSISWLSFVFALSFKILIVIITFQTSRCLWSIFGINHIFSESRDHVGVILLDSISILTLLLTEIILDTLAIRFNDLIIETELFFQRLNQVIRFGFKWFSATALNFVDKRVEGPRNHVF